ncbi:MAG TPA: hypothetical protein PLS66_10065, partial [Tepiditoga sp.]|nr:hypothetical protein [Tepiditoga sp.]
MKITLRYKLILQNIMIFFLVFLVIYFVMINTLYKSVIAKSVDFVSKSVSEYKYYIDEIFKDFDGDNIYSFLKEKSPIISEYMHSKLGIQIEIYDSRKELMSQTSPYNKYYVYQDIYYSLNGKITYIIKNENEGKLLFFASPVYYDNEVIGTVRYIYPMNSEFS